MLSTNSKVDAILDAWLQFIRLEDLSNAKVPLENAKSSDIWLTGNTLKVEKKLFSKIQRANLSESSEQQDKTWVLSFPQVSKVEKGKSMLCPLFSLDITAIFRDDYHTEGWNVETFEMAEAGENLAAFLNLDEEQIEKLVTKNGLRRFLETTFGFDFENLEDWMQRVSLPPYSITSKPYLFEFKGSGFSFNLKKDLKVIREAQTRHWLKSGHPAYEYLFGSPKPPTHETSYLGAFLTNPPTDSQLKAIKHAQSEPLTAVQGPPGSGKTTLILHLIAQQVVNRALSLIEREEDTNNLTVVSSTNNRAVENVIERLREDLPDSFFYLNGGSKKVINQVGGAKEQLQQALDYLQKANFDENRHKSMAAQILKIKQAFVSQERNYQEIQRRRLKDKAQQPEITKELHSLQQQLSERRKMKDNFEKQEITLASYDQLPESTYRKIRSQFNTAELEIPEKAPPKWIRWVYWLFGKTERQILAKMAIRCQPIIDQTIGNPFEIELPLDRSTLHQQRQRIDTGLNQLQELRTIRTNLRKQIEELVNTNQACVEKQLELAAIEERLATPLDDEDYYCKFHIQYHEQHKELFNLSRQYLAEEALRRKVDIEATLKLYLGVLSGTEEDRNRIAGSLHAHLNKISLIFPVITSTLQSIRNMLPWTEQCADRVIVDESGMIPIHQTFPLLVRTHKAIVVGDPLQIEPIVNQSQQTLEQYYQEAFIQKGLTQEACYCYSPAEIGTATTYHRAAGATGEYGDLGQGIQLLEHYRCQPDIINFCDSIANYGLSCKTEPKASLIGANLIAYHVDGKIISKVNRDEIETIHEIIRHLLKHGYNLEDIGVISAFRVQADALRDSLSKEFPQLKNKNAIGTVHTFQGSERRVIILSTKVCRRQDSVDWINRRPNLLNVAVSRAKELFILVGNLHRLEEVGSFTRHLVEHIRERGIILEYKAKAKFAPEDCSSSSASWIYDCDHLEILTEALKEAKQELYVVTPEIRGKAAQKFTKDVVSALKRGVSVTVIYSSPRSSNEDELATIEEKKLKNLFNKYGCARIFRLEGKGTNERILICDTKFAVVGSWNWLSHVYHPACQKQQVTEEVQITRETSLQIVEAKIIKSKKEEIDGLIENLT